MSPTKGWFESDEDYRSRVAREADERTIEDSTGSAPSKGWFENDNDYCARISREADEHRVEDSTGSAPSKGWFENDDDYRDRIHRESNERIIEDSTGTAPSKGWFESDDDYDTRIRKESNEQILLDGTGLASKKGWFEGDHDYRSRIAHEAREIGADERPSIAAGSNSDSSSSYDTDSSYSQSRSPTVSHSSPPATPGGFSWGAFVVIAFIVISLLSQESIWDLVTLSETERNAKHIAEIANKEALKIANENALRLSSERVVKNLLNTVGVEMKPKIGLCSSNATRCVQIFYLRGKKSDGYVDDVVSRINSDQYNKHTNSYDWPYPNGTQLYYSDYPKGTSICFHGIGWHCSGLPVGGAMERINYSEYQYSARTFHGPKGGVVIVTFVPPN